MAERIELVDESEIIDSSLSSYDLFLLFLSNRNENEKGFTTLTKHDLQKIVNDDRRMNLDLRYSDLEIHIGSAKIILFEQKKIKYILVNLHKIEQKLFELVRWSSISFPTTFNISLILYK